MRAGHLRQAAGRVLRRRLRRRRPPLPPHRLTRPGRQIRATRPGTLASASALSGGRAQLRRRSRAVGSREAADVERRPGHRPRPRTPGRACRHQAGMSPAAAGSSAEHPDHRPTGTSGDPLGPARSPAAGSAGRGSPSTVRRPPVTGPLTPASARRSATIPGSSARNRSTCSSVVLPVQRHPDVAVRQHAHRLQHVARPQRRRRARRAGRDREAAPVQRVQQRLAVHVQAGERDQVRQPVDRVADHLDVGHGRRHRGRGSGRPAAASRAASARRLGAPPPAARPPPPRPAAGSPRRLVRRSDRRRREPHAGPRPRAARPRPARPTCGRWPSAPTTRAGTGTRPTDWAASTSSGTPAAAHAAAAAATGCTVPTSWLALISAAAATPGAADRVGERVQVDPARAGRPARSTAVRRRRRGPRPRAAPPSARSPSGRSAGPAGAAPAQQAVAPPDGRPSVPLGVKRHLLRPVPRGSRRPRPGPRRAAGGPGGPAA